MQTCLVYLFLFLAVAILYKQLVPLASRQRHMQRLSTTLKYIGLCQLSQKLEQISNKQRDNDADNPCANCSNHCPKYQSSNQQPCQMPVTFPIIDKTKNK